METLAFAAILGWFSALRLRTYLQYFQQEEYDFPRFIVWYWQAKAYDKWLSIGLLTMVPFAVLQPAATGLMASCWVFYKLRQEPDATKGGKKPLVLTTRASHLWLLAGLLGVPIIFMLAVHLPYAGWYGLLGILVFIQALPLALGFANMLLMPLQTWQNQQYLTEATTTLARLQPTVVSLSGAYGKTSTKYFLHAILNAHAPTLLSPGSTNTPLGLARVVREQLQPYHQYFLAEMGAYKIGSIAGICKLFPPKACATTAIGPAHMERFKTIENVAKAEFEVIDATLQNGGPVVLSIDCIPETIWREKLAQAPQIKCVSANKNWVRNGDYFVKQAKQTAQGLQIAIEHAGQLTAFAAPVYGATMAPNLATAFALATELGVPKTTSVAALKTVQAAPHRLSVRQEAGLTIIDDSYNSNPQGFATALETLALIGAGRRKILITPGMVELGSLHDAEHTRLGTMAAQVADVVLVVAPQRIPTFVVALKGVEVQLLPSFATALQWLKTNGKTDDVVLLENDLPDRYEATWQL